MKKILTIVVVLACALSLFACGGGPAVENVNKMYSVSSPLKVETTSKQVVGGRELNSSSTLTVGKIDGKDATIYESSYEEFEDIETNADNPIKTVTERWEYLEGMGTRVGKGAWDAEGKNFAPTPGSIAIKLTNNTVTDSKLVDNVFTCTVKAENTAAVFGEDRAIGADVAVTITTNGAVVTGITLSYTIPAQAATDTAAATPEVVVTITTKYSYSYEPITLGK